MIVRLMLSVTRFRRLAAAVLLVLSPLASGADGRPPLSAEQVQQLRLFAEVYAAVKGGYVDTIEDKRLIGACLSGMLSGTDPDSAYFDSDAFQELTTSGEIAGVGLELGMDDARPKVVAPIEGGPAEASGVLRGDLIIRIDDLPTLGMTLDDARRRLRGEPNSHITLTVMRAGETKPLAFSVKREILKVPPVKSRSLASGYALVRIAQFQEQTGPMLVRHLQELYKGAPLKGLVLDLRNNPGGLLNVGVGVAAAFLPADSPVVSTRGRTEDSTRDYRAVPGDYLRNGKDYLAALPPEVKNVPMVVLVNGGSAAGSEIVAGALQDHKRAIIMGTKTFGRASIQTVLPLPNKTAIKLTTARWTTPNGRSVRSRGIVPDIVVPDRHGESGSDAARDDYALAQALSLLKDFRRN